MKLNNPSRMTTSHKIFEKYSLPKSVEDLSKEIVKFSMPKYRWWIKNANIRRGRGIKMGRSFSEIFEMTPRVISNDFKISKVRLKLAFVPSRSDQSVEGSGYCFTFNKDYVAPKKSIGYKTLYPKETDRGFEIGVEVRIFIPVGHPYKSSDVSAEILGVAIHELTHMYQSIKLHQKEIDYEDYTSTNTILGMLDYLPGGETRDFFNLLYICLTKSETAAYLSQAHTNTGDYWFRYLDWFKSRSEDKVISEIRKDLAKNRISDEKFLEKWVESEEDNGTEEYFSNLTEVDDILSWAYDTINRRKNYLTKKIGKITYHKMQTQKVAKVKKP